MNWPRGRYNGSRIVGVEVKVRIDVTWWNLRWGSVLYQTCWSVGPVHVWLSRAFE